MDYFDRTNARVKTLLKKQRIYFTLSLVSLMLSCTSLGFYLGSESIDKRRIGLYGFGFGMFSSGIIYSLSRRDINEVNRIGNELKRLEIES